MMLTVVFYRAEAQTNVITGQLVSSEDNSPIPGATVLLKGTSTATATDASGRFSLPAAPGSVLVFSFIGYIPQEVIVGSQANITVTLVPDVTALSEVVVTALGIKREAKALGYSIAQVGGSELATAKEINVINSLSGKVAGVDISTPTAGPSGSSRVIIRGNSELSGNNQPLYIIDGVPMDNTTAGGAGQWGGYDLGDGLSSLNPDDIESVSVLKGGAAAALYGSRASNGVIMITTKTGANQKGIGVEYTGNYTAERVLSRFDDYQKVYGQGRDGILPLENNANNTQSAWGPQLDPNLSLQIYNGETKPYALVNDNILSFFRTGSTFTNTLAFTGGNENASVRVSVSDMHNKDIVPKTGMARNTFLINSTMKLGSKITINGKVNYITEKVDNRPALSDNPNNVGLAIIGIAPNFDQRWLAEGYKDEFGRYQDWNGNTYRINPYWSTNEMSNDSRRNRVIGYLQMNYDFTSWLGLQLRGGTDFYNFRYTNFSPKGTPLWETGALQEQSNHVAEKNYEALLKFDKQFTDDFYVTAFAGGNIMHRRAENQMSTGSGIVLEGIQAITNFTTQSNDYGLFRKQINSLYGTVQTGYKDTYFIDVTARNDWSSTLSKGNNSYFYPSVSGSFVFTNLMDRSPILSFGKLRASAAQVGGDTDPYQLSLTYGLKNFSLLGKPLGEISNTSVPNLELKPTRTFTYEFGTDLRFLENRVQLDLTYYSKKTTDQILPLIIPATSGYNTAIINAGEITNKGVELMLKGGVVSTPAFSWDVMVNYARNVNQVVKLHEQVKEYTLANARWAGAAIMAQEGQTFGTIVGKKLMRDPNGNVVHNAAGLPVFGTEQEVLGKGTYDWTSGITNVLTYKGFRLSALVDIKSGADIYSMSSAIAHTNGTSENTLEGRAGWYASEEARLAAGASPAAWTPTGGYVGKGVVNVGTAEAPNYQPNTTFVNPQSYWAQFLSNSPEPFIYDATYAKLRELTIGYTLPKTLFGRLPIQAASISFVGRNLFILYSNLPNIDPESSYNNGNGQGLEYGSIPSRRSFGANLSIRF
ncbi:SusC/RagA family TonB-linked outer membrane protein [Rufibacter hautae]|uniref:SusC/RagA family TonB-linked outer membrane protein n=1 Tax=Rufibacter hautae TaxID=2595005 RepID=UPI001CC21CC3|nr:SusC/RagA family TonB-linked outer membrane protein [Rufibacter hautae]